MPGNEIKYIAEDFERYYSGNMPAREMHALEKAALDDPILMDALEGYKYAKNPVADRDELIGRLGQKNKRNKVIWLKNKPVGTILKIAAILIVIGGLTWLLNQDTIKKEELATTEKRGLQSPVIKTDSALTDLVKDLKPIEPVTFKTEQKTQDPLSKDERTAKNAMPTIPGELKDQENIIQKKETPGKADVVSRQVTTADPFQKSFDGKVAAQETDKLKRLKGRVTDQQGNPVPFASVADKQNNAAVLTDTKGEFYVKSKDTSPKVEITALGYEPVIKELKKESDSNNTVLRKQANNELSEVVVSGVGIERKAKRGSNVLNRSREYEAENRRVAITNAIPVDGWQHYYQYASDSLRTIGQLAIGSVNTEVELTFRIDKQGKPVDVTTKKSLCPACEVEAIRFIKNSPTLKLNQKRKKVIAVIRF